MSERADSPRSIRSLGVEAPGRIYYWEYQEGPLEPGRFRVNTLYTGLSAGTELTFFKGTNPYLHSSWNPDLGLFQSNQPSQGYPVPFLGYMEVAQVTATRTAAVKEGDIVAMTYGHKTGHTADPVHEFFFPLPPDLDKVLGIYVAQMGPIVANGLLHAAADQNNSSSVRLSDGVEGRQVLIVGGGAIGLMCGLWAKQLGAAEVAVADATEERRKVAREFGLVALDLNEEPARWTKERWLHGPADRGADVVFQCRATSDALQIALRCLRPQGTVIDLAFYQGGADTVRLGEEFHHNGLRIHCAQIGRVPRGLHSSWDRRRLATETIRFLDAEGHQIRRHMISEIAPYDEAQRIFEDIAERRRHFLQVVFRVAHA